MNRPAYRIATILGLGEILPAPGTTAGSLPTAYVWFVCAWFAGSSRWLFVLSVIAFATASVAGVWAAGLEVTRRGRRDPGPVVIDEVAGQLLTYCCALPLWYFEDSVVAGVMAAAGFALFRLFGILKPWPVRRLQRLEGGLGVVADDIAAGIMAGLVLALSALPLMRLVEDLR